MLKIPSHLEEVAAILSSEYGDFNHFNKKDPLDELIFIFCSVRTEERLYLPVYKAIKRNYPTAQSLYRASQKKLERILRPAGLSNTKAKYIKESLRIIVTEFGKLTMAPLKNMTDEDCEFFLTSLPNVGKKVARCIMMYSLGRYVFPVDIHCWRISLRLGWIRKTRKDGKPSWRDMDRLQSKIPLDLRHSLHVNMVSHGRKICVKRKALCSVCVIKPFCKQIGLRDVV